MNHVNSHAFIKFFALLGKGLLVGVMIFAMCACMPRDDKIVERDMRFVSLIEEHFAVKVIPSVQRISTCYNYDSSGCEWGVLCVLSQEDIGGFCDTEEWEYLGDEASSYAFPTEFSIREVMWGKTVRWWNPLLVNCARAYVKKTEKRTMRMLINRTPAGWVKVFMLMEAYSDDMPYEVTKALGDANPIDVLITEKYLRLSRSLN